MPLPITPEKAKEIFNKIKESGDPLNIGNDPEAMDIIEKLTKERAEKNNDTESWKEYALLLEERIKWEKSRAVKTPRPPTP